MLCAASYSTGEPDIYRRCVNNAEHRRVFRVDGGWVVTVDLCVSHAELWVATVPVEVAHGRQ
jgi:hypothetical protein